MCSSIFKTSWLAWCCSACGLQYTCYEMVIAGFMYCCCRWMVGLALLQVYCYRVACWLILEGTWPCEVECNVVWIWTGYWCCLAGWHSWLCEVCHVFGRSILGFGHSYLDWFCLQCHGRMLVTVCIVCDGEWYVLYVNALFGSAWKCHG